MFPKKAHFWQRFNQPYVQKNQHEQGLGKNKWSILGLQLRLKAKDKVSLFWKRPRSETFRLMFTFLQKIRYGLQLHTSTIIFCSWLYRWKKLSCLESTYRSFSFFKAFRRRPYGSSKVCWTRVRLCTVHINWSFVAESEHIDRINCQQ